MKRKCLTEWIKRTVGVGLLAVGLLMTSGRVEAASASAPIVDKGDNSIKGKAIALELGKNYAGIVTSDNKVDWYKFTIPEGARGYYTVTLKPDAMANTDKLHDGWSMGFYTWEGAESLVGYSGIKGVFTSQAMPYGPGTYYIKITPWISSPEEYYNICINFQSASNWECEPNNKQEAATILPVNQTYSGNLESKTDIDWYKVTLSNPGKITLNLGPNASSNGAYLGDGWNVKLFLDGKSENLIVRSYIKGITTSNNHYVAAGTYYIAVWQNYNCPAGCDYDLKLDYAAAPNCEMEYNDTAQTANPVSMGQTYTGNLYGEKDPDYYVFTANATGRLTLSFSREPVSNPSDGYYVAVLDSGSNVICKYSYLKDATATLSDIKVVSGQTYYVYVSSQYTSYLDGIDYHFTLNIKPGDISPAVTKTKMTVTYAKSTMKKRASLIWKMNSNADGYKIYRSTKKKKGYKCVGTIKYKQTCTWTDVKVKAGKTYYYKLRAYKIENGKTYYSKYSSVKKIKVKKR